MFDTSAENEKKKPRAAGVNLCAGNAERANFLRMGSESSYSAPRESRESWRDNGDAENVDCVPGVSRQRGVRHVQQSQGNHKPDRALVDPAKDAFRIRGMEIVADGPCGRAGMAIRYHKPSRSICGTLAVLVALDWSDDCFIARGHRIGLHGCVRMDCGARPNAGVMAMSGGFLLRWPDVGAQLVAQLQLPSLGDRAVRQFVHCLPGNT